VQLPVQHHLLPRTTAAAGFNSRILTMLGTLVDTCLDPSQLKIYMTGAIRALARTLQQPTTCAAFIWCCQRCFAGC
jgi:hypothetical protein